MKKILALFFVFALFAGCSPDDKPEAINYPIEKSIIGKWILKGYESNSGYVEYNNLCEEKKDFLEFADNGRSTEQAFNENCETSYTINASWTINDVYLSMDNDEDEVGKYYKIVLLRAKLKTTLYYSK
jgi:hypothetical protein